MAIRFGKVESHERGKSVDFGERHRFDSSELGERLVEASDVLGERSRGVIFEGHALFEAAYNKLMSDSSARAREQSEDGFPSISTAGGGSVIVGCEHFEEGAERAGSVLERFPKAVMQNGFGTKSVRSDKRFSHGNMQLLFLRREGGPLDDSKLDKPKIARAELGQEVAAKRE